MKNKMKDLQKENIESVRRILEDQNKTLEQLEIIKNKIKIMKKENEEYKNFITTIDDLLKDSESSFAEKYRNFKLKMISKERTKI